MIEVPFRAFRVFRGPKGYAALLCELRQQRVRERAPVYLGMMSYEKAVRELPFLGFMFEMPIVVAGVGVSGN